MCLFCKWTTRESSIPDSKTQSANWPEPENPTSGRIAELYAHYKSLAMQEKAEKERRRVAHRATHAMHLLDKYGISAALSPKVSQSLREKYYGKQAAMSSSSGGMVQQATVASKAVPSVAQAIVQNEDYDEIEVYKKPLDVSVVSSLDQRLRAIELQPPIVTDFRPVSQMLSVKRSLRCKVCDHNLSKPECNPSSIKFKILLAAFYHVPEIRVKEWQSDHVLLTVQNPTPYELKVEMQPLENCVYFPPIQLTIPPKDETLDIDLELGADRSKKQEYPEAVVLAKGHKLTVKLPIDVKISAPGTSETIQRPYIAIILKHDFVKALIHVPGSEKREPQIESVSQKVIVREPRVSR